MYYAVIIAACIVIAKVLMGADKKQHASQKTVYDYRENPEVLNDFIH